LLLEERMFRLRGPIDQPVMEGASMRKSLLSAPLEAAPWEPKYPFDLVIAYSDLETRDRAMRLHDHLSRQLNDDYDLHCSWWKFDHLADPTLFDQAIDDALDANMIVLSLHAETELPPAARAWIDGWAHRSDHQKCALVTLYAEPSERPESSPVCAFLRQAARLAHMDFFTNIAEAAAGLTIERVAERARAVTPTLEEILHHPLPAPRWGINES
jgi:hypothetical protein